METKVTMLCGPAAAVELESDRRRRWNDGQGERERKMIKEGGH